MENKKSETQEEIKKEIERVKELIKSEKGTVKEALKKLLKELEEKRKKEEEKEKNKSKKSIISEINKINEEIKKAYDKNDLKKYNDLKRKKRSKRKELENTNGKIKYLRVNQIKKVLKIIEKESKNKERDKLLIILGFELGARASEVLDIKRSDIDIEQGTIKLRRLKNSDSVLMELKEETMELLENYLKKYQIKEYLFLNSKKERLSYNGLDYIIKRYYGKANIEKELQHYHTLKHSRGVWLAENGFSIHSINFLLGHKNIENTMIYTSYSRVCKEQIFDKIKGIKTW